MRRASERFEGGFGLIEIIVAMASLLIGLLVYGGLTLTVNRGVGASAERALAIEGAQARLELLWSTPFDECFAAFDESTALFGTYTPDEIGALKGQKRNEIIALATILDDYNNGLTGPGHCTE